MLKYSVGLDISANQIHCCISVIDGSQRTTVKSTRKIANTKKGFTELGGWIARHQKDKSIPLVVCMEATGVYYEHCALYLFKAGLRVSVVLPNQAKKYLQACGQKSKNDRVDARGLAQMGAEKSLRIWNPMGEYFYVLRELTRQNQTLNELRTAESNRLHALELGMYNSKPVISQVKKILKLIDKQIAQTEELIGKHIESDPEIAKKVDRLCTIKSVGIKTVATVLAETNGFELFTNARQLASFAGYDVIENQSGKHNGRTRISKQGNSHIRRILYMPALVAVGHRVAPFFDLYQRTYQRHRIKMKSYVAVQKKILVVIYALWKKNEPFSPQTEENKHTEERKPESPLGAEAVADENQGKDVKKIVPAEPALHKVDIPSEQSPYVSSRVLQS